MPMFGFWASRGIMGILGLEVHHYSPNLHYHVAFSPCVHVQMALFL